jgi:hypothetical protein
VPAEDLAIHEVPGELQPSTLIFREGLQTKFTADR